METSDSRQTIRQQIIDLLGSDTLTVRDLSQAVSIPEKEVMEHLGHIERSVRNQGKKLMKTPYKCLLCGFVFDNRIRFSKPGRCPSCKKSHIQTARYHIE
ncbi:MAG: transcriptional regulator [Deltaproteobacteria bacterium]|jgi:predicted Zn-ribbon and HTH transcriptional regulator|nr:transcriptional regulator [Deltaproteobacteria bacterium]